MTNTGYASNSSENLTLFKKIDLDDEIEIKSELTELYGALTDLVFEHSVLMEDFYNRLMMTQSPGRDIVGDALDTVYRKLILGKQNDLKKAAHKIFDRYNALCGRINAITGQLGFEPFHFNCSLRDGDFELDNSASDDDWVDGFMRVWDEFLEMLKDLEEAASRVDRQFLEICKRLHETGVKQGG